MVLQLNGAQRAHIAPTEPTSPLLEADARVLFLVDTTRAPDTVTHRAGRVGRVSRLHVNRVQNARRDDALETIQDVQITDERRNYDGRASQVAVINPVVVAGMQIVDIDDSYGHHNIGVVGTVESMSGTSYLVYRDAEGQRRSSYRWVISDTNTVTPQDYSDAPEDLRISQWWVNRIQSIARDEGKRRRWCSELEEVLQRLLEPIKAGGYKIEPVSSTDQPDSEVVAYEVWDGTGQFAASFRDEAEAKKYVEEKNKKLPPVYQATL